METQVAEKEVNLGSAGVNTAEPEKPYVIANPEEFETVKSLLDKITWLTQCFSNNPVVPILENLMFHKGVIYCSNLQVTQMINTAINGTFLIPAVELKKILKELDKTDKISFGGEGSSDTLKLFINGKPNFKFSAEHPDDFPLTIKCKETVAEFTGSKDFETLVTLNGYVSTDDLRPAMKCVCLDKEMAVATNGHWLAMKKLQDFLLHKDVTILLPTQITKIIKDFKHATIKMGESSMAIKYFLIKEEERAVVFKAIDENFPNYTNVIPKRNHVNVSVSKKVLIKMIKLAMLTANKTTYRGIISLVHGTQLVGMSSECLDFSREFRDEIPATTFTWTPKITDELQPEEKDESGKVIKAARISEVKGEAPKVGDSFDIGVNLKFLSKIVADVEGDEISLAMSEPNRAIMINKDFLLMPTMINQYV